MIKRSDSQHEEQLTHLKTRLDDSEEKNQSLREENQTLLNELNRFKAQNEFLNSVHGNDRELIQKPVAPVKQQTVVAPTSSNTAGGATRIEDLDEALRTEVNNHVMMGYEMCMCVNTIRLSYTDVYIYV